MNLELKDAFKKDIEILFGYVSMGFCFGVLLAASGFSWIYALIMSIFVYSGVMQFLAISFFGGGFGLFNIFITTLILNSRQSFYTLIMLPLLRKMNWKKFFSIFWLTDETFAIVTSKKPASQDSEFIFWVGMLNYFYWIFGCVSGAVIGEFMRFDTRGLEFIMTAIFVVIFIDQQKAAKSQIFGIVGILIGIFWLFILGAQYFLIASILTCIALLFVFQTKLEHKI